MIAKLHTTDILNEILTNTYLNWQENIICHFSLPNTTTHLTAAFPGQAG